MALKAWLAKIDEAAEADRKLYKELPEGGGFIPDIEAVGGWRIEDVDGVKKGLGAARAKITQLQKELLAFEGFKPDEVLTLREELEQLRIAGDGKGKEALERLKKELGEKHQRDLEKAAADLKVRDQQLSELNGLLDSEAIDAAAGYALTKHRGDDVLLPHVRSALRPVKGQNGKRVVRVLDEHGNERMTSKSGSMEPMGVEEYVESLKTKYPKNFTAEVQSGAGANGGSPQTGSNGSIQVAREAMYDPANYAAAKAKAEATGRPIEVLP